MPPRAQPLCRRISANTISTPFIAEMKESDQTLSISLSPQDCGQEDGHVLNILFGKKLKPLAKKSKMISPQLLKISKSDFSMEIKESSQPSSTRDSPDKPLFEVEKRKIEYDNARDWEIGLDSRYSEDEVISILNIVSCMENKRRGFGNKNDDECLRDERKADTSNRLYEEAIYGLELLAKGRSRNPKRARLCAHENTAESFVVIDTSTMH